METIIQAVFAPEADARKGQQALAHLDATMDVSLSESYLISRNTQTGEAIIKSAKGETIGASTLGGGLIGGLLGLVKTLRGADFARRHRAVTNYC